MELEYKPDWPQAVERWEAFWRHEVLDRPVIAVTAPQDGVTRRSVTAPADLRTRWWDYEYRIDAAMAVMEATWYGGEAFPMYLPNLGPDCFASWLGAPLEFMETTSWARPIIEDWEQDLDKIRFAPECATWQWQLEATAAAGEAGAGKFLVGLADLHGGMDAVAALRHPDRLCLDLIDQPDMVASAMARITPVFFEVYEAMDAIARRTQTGSTTWLPAYTQGRWYPTSCDYAALIGPAHFDTFVLPDLRAQCDWLDCALYHLDGPDAIRHVPSLCSLENLHAIQWVHGAGAGPMTRWIELLQDIQARGKGLHLAVTPEEIKPLLEVLSPGGVCFHTACRSRAEGEALLDAAAEWVKNP